MLNKILNSISELVSPDPMPEIGPVKSNKPRILYIVTKYPEYSETYMHEEMVAMSEDYELRIVDYEKSKAPRKNNLPHIFINYRDSNLSYGSFRNINTEFTNPAQVRFMEKLDHIIQEFKPEIIHTHYLPNAWLVRKLADKHQIPFTVRVHSFDIMINSQERMQSMMDAINSPLCKQVFTYPEFLKVFEDHGIANEKVQAYWPISNTSLFQPSMGNKEGKKVMCAGPCTAKKAHDRFIDLAYLMRDTDYTFDLYTEGNSIAKIKKYNAEHGHPVNINYADPEDMPSIYKQYDWLVYPSDTKINKVGLPVAVIEAQACGLGVCLQELPGRKNAQLDFLGGGGYLFNTVEEVRDIINQVYPDNMRQAGFENISKCDVAVHKRMLNEVWGKVIN